ncbi:hypothetical protein [Streptomyces sp. H51]|uniref:hypothetical protein n=1 Tax=Streptomyces sp. H51 TaxID=3111770 RepID=UPI002D785154|nr:hypothetical protein [Streptomyces sp. H51]
MTVLRLIGWAAAAFGLLFLIVATPVGIGWIFFPLLVYAFFRAFLQFFCFPSSLRMRRVLQQYPWQVLPGVPRGLARHPEAQEDGMWFEFANPEDPAERIPLIFLRSMRTYWWLRRIGGPRTKPEVKARIEPLWFAGDPRFLAVIAAPARDGRAPQRLHLLYQRPALDRRIPPRDRNAGPAALERARRAGARIPDSVSAPDTGQELHEH